MYVLLVEHLVVVLTYFRFSCALLVDLITYHSACFFIVAVGIKLFANVLVTGMVEATQEKAKPKEEKPAAAKDDKKKTGKEEKKDEMVSCKGRFGENEYDLRLCLKTEEDKKLEEDLNMLVQRLSVSSSCDIFSFSGFSSKAFLLGE